jgi:methionyl-tRNA formyltransferase
MTRVVFMGSPDFALPSLQALLDAPDFEVVGVVTQPDRPAGRGNKLTPSPVKRLALAQGLPVYQPEKLRGPEAEATLKAWNADLHVVTAYGQILRPSILAIPRLASINVHASLLPRWRGAAPIQAAVRAGDTTSGLTIMFMDEGLDTGDMLAKIELELDPRETGGSLHDKLAAHSGALLVESLRRLLAGQLSPQKQDESLATYAPQIEKSAGRIQWGQSALEIDRHVRAFDPRPGTYSTLEGRLLKILAGVPLEGQAPIGCLERGTAEYPLIIGTGAGVYAPTLLQEEGKNRVSAADFLNGHPQVLGKTLV